MAIDIVVPDLGESITEATVSAWLKKPGDAVAADEPVVELETDKATVELPAPRAGVMGEILVPAGEDVAVGAVLGRLEEAGASSATATPEPGGAPSAQQSAAKRKTAAAIEAPVEPAPVAPPAAAASSRAAASTPEATLSSEALGAVRAQPAGATTVPSSRAPDLDPGRFAGEGPLTLAGLKTTLGIAPEQLGPAVRQLVAERGVDPALIPGTGKGGRVTREDVLAHLEAAAAAPAQASAPAASPAAVSAAPREERVRMSRMRRTIAARLKAAQQTAAILTTFNEADMGAVRDLRAKHREAFEAKHGVRLGFTSFFAKACVAALKAVPSVNAEIDGEEVVYKHHYDLGMAVASKHGLVVPVIRDCDTRSFAEIEAVLAELAGKARDGKLSNEEMSGGTFSITNGGVFGSLLSTPILNPPQSAILGLHKIEDRPVAKDGEVVIRPMMYLALSYDHRMIDGREAVTFLVKVKEAIEDPERLLLDL